MEKLREEFEKPWMIEIKHDENEVLPTYIPLIQLQIIQEDTGKQEI